MSIDDLVKMEPLEISKQFYQDSISNVVQCWWGGRIIECNGTFANQILDSGRCFTFVTKKEFAHLMQHTGIN